ncbi:MAG: hypothetical protein ACM34B_13735 [Nitrospira sp.]
MSAFHRVAIQSGSSLLTQALGFILQGSQSAVAAAPVRPAASAEAGSVVGGEAMLGPAVMDRSAREQDAVLDLPPS